MTPERWERTGPDAVTDHGVVRVRSFRARSPRTGEVRRIAVLEPPDWVNVVAVTGDGEVVLVRQWRHGTSSVTLEVPGGIVDPGESPEDAARRELREETGHAGGDVAFLGTVEPNPAIQSNRVHTFLIRGCREVGELEMDPGEDIEVVRLPLSEIPVAIDDGRITHALVVCAFWWFFRTEGG